MICGMCLSDEDMIYRRLRDYIYEHPENTTIQVSMATGVPMRIINKMHGKERVKIINTKANNNQIYCDSCGKPIKFGVMCEPCFTKQKKKYKT